MNYERVYWELLHKRGGTPMEKRRMPGKSTWLRRVRGGGEVEGFGGIFLELFGNRILTWFADGRIRLEQHNWWSRTTLRRFAEYLPSDFRIHPAGQVWLIQTPTGFRPFREDVVLTAEGRDVYAPEGHQLDDARGLLQKARAYAKTYAAHLVRGDIDEFDTCEQCIDRSPVTPESVRAHILEHLHTSVMSPSLIHRAMICHGARQATHHLQPTLTQVIAACWPTARTARLRPHTKKAQLLRTEYELLRGEILYTDIQPHKYRKNLQSLLEDYVLERLGFDINFHAK